MILDDDENRRSPKNPIKLEDCEVPKEKIDRNGGDAHTIKLKAICTMSTEEVHVDSLEVFANHSCFNEKIINKYAYLQNDA